MITSRALEEEDWEQISWLASNEVQEADHSQLDAAWVSIRRAFTGERRDCVIVSEDQVVGYCAVERDKPGDDYRAFLVADWRQGITETHEALFRALENLIATGDVRRVWMRELTDDETLNGFVAAKGFSVGTPFEADGLQMVIMTREFDDSSA